MIYKLNLFSRYHIPSVMSSILFGTYVLLGTVFNPTGMEVSVDIYTMEEFKRQAAWVNENIRAIIKGIFCLFLIIQIFGWGSRAII